jgi:hypothetical protein
MWWPDPKGTFTVKSTYKLANTSLIDTSSYHIAVHWLKVWNIKAPPTIIFFIWRVRRNCFPTFLLERSAMQQYRRECTTFDDSMSFYSEHLATNRSVEFNNPYFVEAANFSDLFCKRCKIS